ncbi:type IV pilin protein [Microbacterium timonense]|uniref:type IV pilin protein n=1 Tax=Microbacterium timonense TaxID=2086576 RepID=UPI002E0D6201
MSSVILEKASRTMRSFIRNYIQAEKARREESGEAGFSLIELIVVVVILGILAAVAIPVFLGLQAQAEESSVNSVIANGASQVASDLGLNKTDAEIRASLTKLGTQSNVTLTVTPASGLKIDNFCVSGTKTGVDTTKIKSSGPGCSGATPTS